ncbi:MAG TPA: hypothetical protein VMC84_11390 [Methanocella sp.]|uniref:hypothetical protein n=1 Tax=Methanocella sp. TaxID=2052833 RepID=UPI002C06D4A0|nr:hypothetical protein [Methanocella sp.]HTY91770.1 hypothetical protein [Methanocella sp.]
MVHEPYSIKNVVREIQYDVAYLEDAPDEMLAPFVESLGIIGERLLKLKEILSRQ